MIDIHTHVLPFVDDGSRDIETSLTLIKEAVKQGVTDIFVTPHYMMQRGYVSPANKNIECFNQLKKQLQKNQIRIELHLGTEIYYDRYTLSYLREGKVIPLANSKYVLIEFSLSKESEDIADAVNNLTAVGFKPIIAHPERYPYLKSLEAYAYLKRMGAFIQVNASSILGDYGRKIKKFVFQLIKHHLVDFIASDMHDFRRPDLKKVYQVITKEFSKETAEALLNNRVILGKNT